MSGRKNKNRQRGQQRREGGEPTELLDELNSIRNLLGSDELGDIPLLDQVAAPAPAPQLQPVRHKSQQHITPLQDSDLPTLFSPEDEELAEEELLEVGPGATEPPIAAELSEAERNLLRPLEAIPPRPEATSAKAKPTAGEQQRELFGNLEASPITGENPFLPEHIRARLTGGRVPRSEAAAPENDPAQPDEQGQPATAPSAPPDDQPDNEPAGAARGDADGPMTEAGTDGVSRTREEQRQQLIDRLVARQLPDLERQLRARIELMVDELLRHR